MANKGVSKVTPTKITTRNAVCRFCGGCQDTRHMVRIFSKALCQDKETVWCRSL